MRLVSFAEGGQGRWSPAQPDTNLCFTSYWLCGNGSITSIYLSGLCCLTSRMGFVMKLRDSMCRLLAQPLARVRTKGAVNGSTQPMWEIYIILVYERSRWHHRHTLHLCRFGMETSQILDLEPTYVLQMQRAYWYFDLLLPGRLNLVETGKHSSRFYSASRRLCLFAGYSELLW